MVCWKIYVQIYATIVDYNGAINLTKGAIVCCDRLTTVSPTYAKEIQTAQYAHGLEDIIRKNSAKLTGILRKCTPPTS